MLNITLRDHKRNYVDSTPDIMLGITLRDNKRNYVDSTPDIMLGITLSNHKHNIWIRHQAGVNDIINVIKKGIYGWAGHIARFKDNTWTTRVTEWTPREWTRRQRRPNCFKMFQKHGYNDHTYYSRAKQHVQGPNLKDP